eukprot:SAG31_NODE_1862_length_7044_cov_11.784017_6_plen_966_part_00
MFGRQDNIAQDAKEALEKKFKAVLKRVQQIEIELTSTSSASAVDVDNDNNPSPRSLTSHDSVSAAAAASEVLHSSAAVSVTESASVALSSSTAHKMDKTGHADAENQAMPKGTVEGSTVMDSVPQPVLLAANSDLNHVTAARARPRLGRRPSLSSVRRKQFQSSQQELLEPPASWEEIIDQTTGHPYYHNVSSGEVSWNRPAAFQLCSKPADPGLVAPLSAKLTTSEKSSSSSTLGLHESQVISDNECSKSTAISLASDDVPLEQAKHGSSSPPNSESSSHVLTDRNGSPADQTKGNAPETPLGGPPEASMSSQISGQASQMPTKPKRETGGRAGAAIPSLSLSTTSGTLEPSRLAPNDASNGADPATDDRQENANSTLPTPSNPSSAIPIAGAVSVLVGVRRWKRRTAETLVLHTAAKNGDCEALRLHLDGIEHANTSKVLDALDAGGRTPFHIACWWDQSRAAASLAVAGCNQFLTDRQGRTGRQVAEHEGNDGVLAVLAALDNDRRWENSSFPRRWVEIDKIAEEAQSTVENDRLARQEVLDIAEQQARDAVQQAAERSDAIADAVANAITETPVQLFPASSKRPLVRAPPAQNHYATPASRMMLYRDMPPSYCPPFISKDPNQPYKAPPSATQFAQALSFQHKEVEAKTDRQAERLQEADFAVASAITATVHGHRKDSQVSLQCATKPKATLSVQEVQQFRAEAVLRETKQRQRAADRVAAREAEEERKAAEKAANKAEVCRKWREEAVRRERQRGTSTNVTPTGVQRQTRTPTHIHGDNHSPTDRHSNKHSATEPIPDAEYWRRQALFLQTQVQRLQERLDATQVSSSPWQPTPQLMSPPPPHHPFWTASTMPPSGPTRVSPPTLSVVPGSSWPGLTSPPMVPWPNAANWEPTVIGSAWQSPPPWIAESGGVSTAPVSLDVTDGWACAMSKTHGKMYYVNKRTGTTQWTFPSPRSAPSAQ